MALFGKSNQERHIESIHQQLIIINSNMKNLMIAIERGREYCSSHRSDIGYALNSIATHFNTIKSHTSHIPEQKLATVQVAWGDGISTNSFMMWGMLTDTGMDEIAEQLTKWGI